MTAGPAATLPEVKAAEEEARQKTARQFWRLGPARKRRLFLVKKRVDAFL